MVNANTGAIYRCLIDVLKCMLNLYWLEGAQKPPSGGFYLWAMLF
jgi:hypothetical protein